MTAERRSAWTPLRCAGWCLVTCALVAASLVTIHLLDVRDRPTLLTVVPDSTTRVDAYGDPLPVGAVARLGSRRYRVGEGDGLAILPDGERFVAGMADGRIGEFDIETGERRRVSRALQEWRRPFDATWSLRWLSPLRGHGPRPAWTRPSAQQLALAVGGRHFALCGPPLRRSWSLRTPYVDPRGQTLVSTGHGSGLLQVHPPDQLGDELGAHRLFWTSGRVDNTGDGRLTLFRLPGPSRIDVPFDPATTGAWSESVSPDGRRVVLLLVGWEPADRVVRPDVLSLRLQVNDVDSDGELWHDWVFGEMHHRVAWGDDGSIWIVRTDGLENRDTDDGRVLRSGNVVRARSWRIAVSPELGVAVVGDRAFELPEGLAARWSDIGACSRDLSILREDPGVRFQDLAARRTSDGLVALARGGDGIVRAAWFSGRGPARTNAESTADGPRAAIRSLAWSPDGNELAALDDTGTVRLWTPGAPGPCWTCAPRSLDRTTYPAADRTIHGLGFTRDGREVVVWDPRVAGGPRLRLLSRVDGQRRPIPDAFGDVADLLIAPVSDHVAALEATPEDVGYMYVTCTIRDVLTGREGASFVSQATLVGLSSVGGGGAHADLVAAEGVDRAQHGDAWDRGAVLEQISVDGTRWSVLSEPGHFRRHHPSLTRPFAERWATGTRLEGLRVLREDRHVKLDAAPLAGKPGWAPEIRGWKRRWGRQRTGWQRTFRPAPTLEVSPDGRLGLLFDGSARALLLDLDASELVFALPLDPGPVTAVVWHPDGRLLATGTQDGTILIWDVAEMIEHGR